MKTGEQSKKPAFEQEVERLGLTTPEQMKKSSALRTWVERNFEMKFVPEHLLTAYGLSTPEFV
jgi:hypothetical protein